MIPENLTGYKIILASQSPRRKFLLKELGLDFEVSDLHETDEVYPEHLGKFEIPVYLSELKSSTYGMSLKMSEILITADTIVWFRDQVINKPVDRQDALNILSDLSGNMHEVITGVSLRTSECIRSFYSHSEVYFNTLREKEIEYYVDKYLPYDKAGGYGIQEWIGYIGIKRINGSYYNVMGLPVEKLYRELEKIVECK